MQKYIVIFLSILFINAYADDLTCPAQDQIKSVKLIKAMQNENDPECWNFISTSFTHDNKEWNVGFGTFLPDAKTEDEALKEGQAYFDQAPLIIENPEPVDIPNKIICDYMPPGHHYWITALTPPDKSSIPK